MQEFWFCEACKSMNRGDAATCYRCRAPRAHATMATIHERRLPDVIMPGIDQLEPGQARALLAQHPYDPAWPFGYFSLVMVGTTILFQFGCLLCGVASLVALIVPNIYSLGPGWSLILTACLLGYGVFMAITVVTHSVFLGLLDRNVPSLGGGQPRFGTPRASAWWIETYLWVSRAQLTVSVPLLIGLATAQVVGLFGVPFAFALLWLSIRVLQGPLYSLRKPARLLEDLIRRLAVRGTSDTSLVSMWSASWVTARMIGVLSPVLVAVGATLLVLVAIIGMMRSAFGSAQASELSLITSIYMMTAVFILLALAEVVADAIALMMLARVTLSLSGSERARRNWIVQSAAGSPSPVATAHPAASGSGAPAVVVTRPPAGGASDAPLPDEPPSPSKRVLHPSLRVLPRYGMLQRLPSDPPLPDEPPQPPEAPPLAPADEAPAPEADWPEGM